MILLRRSAHGPEVLLLRRRKGASFMASAFVFPGGGADPGEDARTAAARELFEEAGVLLARDAVGGRSATMHDGPSLSDAVAPPDADTLLDEDVPPAVHSIDELRARVLAGEHATAVLAASGLTWWTDVLVPWAHWITPSTESPRRFSARFFVAELPEGQAPRFDDVETVEQIWVAPADAIARAGELMLPPPQLRTMWELQGLATIEAVLAAAQVRAGEPHPILPRRATGDDGGPCLLLPWDPEYGERGTGESAPLTYHPAWARGPSRFVLEDRSWKHVAAPGSTTAG